MGVWRSTTTVPLADRAGLQVGQQVASSYQAILWRLGECRENPNLDRRLGLYARRDRQEAAESPGLAAHFVTDCVGYSVRENIVAIGTYRK
jgi:hypothetical protein